MDSAILIDNLTKKYKNNRGVQGISLEVRRGEIFGFLGPNGAGKTTAMKVMTGLMTADEGDCYINGYSVSAQYEKAMANTGCIIETVTPYAYLTAFENMKLVQRFYPEVDTKRIDYCLERTGLLPYKNEKTKNFSLGMKQRMGIAMAILHNPNILILDEPLNGLDVSGMVEMRNLILELAQNDEITFFISSHLIHDVELTCNKVGILFDGKLLNVDYTKHILENYSSLENYYLSEVNTNARP